MNSELLEQYIKFLHDRGLRNARKNLTEEINKRSQTYKESGRVRLGEMNEIMYEYHDAIDNFPDNFSKEYNELLKAFTNLENIVIPEMQQTPSAVDYFYRNSNRFSNNQTLKSYALRMASTIILNHYDNFISSRESKTESGDKTTPVIDIDIDKLREIISEPLLFAYSSVYGEEICYIDDIPFCIDKHMNDEYKAKGKCQSRVEFLKPLIEIYKLLENGNKKTLGQLRDANIKQLI